MVKKLVGAVEKLVTVVKNLSRHGQKLVAAWSKISRDMVEKLAAALENH